jgi:hypothetical protein
VRGEKREGERWSDATRRACVLARPERGRARSGASWRLWTRRVLGAVGLSLARACASGVRGSRSTCLIRSEREVRRGEQVCMVVIMWPAWSCLLILCAFLLLSEGMACLSEVR